MALPVILIDSATGSDSLASGAGPSTALTGTAATTDGAGTLVTLDGSPSLTNVATDGSHVIYLADATAGARNFGKITAKDDGAKTVTVSDAFGLSLSGKSWAIGGVRASIGGTNSVKLFVNNGGNGDAMPGWAIEMQSGHTETIGSTINTYRVGDTTSGCIDLRGASGTQPVLTFTNGGQAFIVRDGYRRFKNFEVRNTNGGADNAFQPVGSANNVVIEQVKVCHASNTYQVCVAVVNNSLDALKIIDCEFAYATSHGINIDAGATQQGCEIIGCNVHHCGGDGLNLNATQIGPLVHRSQFWLNTGSGIHLSNASTSGAGSVSLINNTCHDNGDAGIEVANNNASLIALRIINNEMTNNSGYGLKFSGGSISALIVLSYQSTILGNNTGTGAAANTSGACNLSGVLSSGATIDPDYVSAATGDFTPQETTLKGTAYPTTLGPATNYAYPGAIQPDAVGGGGGMLRALSLSGGLI